MHNYSRQKIPVLYNGPLHPKIAHSHGGSGPPSNTLLVGHTRVKNPNGISIGSAVFAQLAGRRVHIYYTLGRSLSLKIAPSHGGYRPHLVHVSLGHPCPQSKRNLNRLSRFAGLTTVTDRPTDHATRVCNNWPPRLCM